MFQCPNGTQSTLGRICRSARSSFFPDETTAIDNENANYLRSRMTKPLSIADIFINVVSFGLACRYLILVEIILKVKIQDKNESNTERH